MKIELTEVNTTQQFQLKENESFELFYKCNKPSKIIITTYEREKT